MAAVLSYLQVHFVWIFGVAGFLLFISFFQTNGDTTRFIAGIIAALGVLVFFLA